MFFFKQKTAYEMRISDWSSDVCSSDLLFAANMLLAGRERQHETALAVCVDGFAAQAARHLTDIFALAGEEADIGAAELEPDADRLSLAHHDIGAHFPGRLNPPHRDRFGAHRAPQATSRLARGGHRPTHS